jgi:hypothetical protein
VSRLADMIPELEAIDEQLAELRRRAHALELEAEATIGKAMALWGPGADMASPTFVRLGEIQNVLHDLDLQIMLPQVTAVKVIHLINNYTTK